MSTSQSKKRQVKQVSRENEDLVEPNTKSMKLGQERKKTRNYVSNGLSDVGNIEKGKSKGKTRCIRDADEKCNETSVFKPSCVEKQKKKEIGYIQCTSPNRFSALCCFIRKHFQKKSILVICSTDKTCHFYAEVMNSMGIPVSEVVAGRSLESEKSSTIRSPISKSPSGVVMCTFLALTSADLSTRDWVIQFDPPSDASQVLSVQQQLGGDGMYLIFLLPQDMLLLEHLKSSDVELSEYALPLNQLGGIQSQVSKMMHKNFSLNALARIAYASYMKRYYNHSMSNVFKFSNLVLGDVCKGFGLEIPPHVEFAK